MDRNAERLEAAAEQIRRELGASIGVRDPKDVVHTVVCDIRSEEQVCGAQIGCTGGSRRV